MHSNDNCISADELKAAFTTMKKLLQDDIFKNLEECTTAVKELDKLKKENIICEIDESNETWKLAIDIQNKARGDKEIADPSPEATHILLTKVQIQLQEEKVLQLQSELLKSKEQIQNDQRQREYDRRQREYEQERARDNLKRLESQLEDSKHKHQIDMQYLNAKNEELTKEVNKLVEHNPTLRGRILKGTATGTGVGLLGGPVGACVGGAAGGVVGGISYFWDRLTK
ncbi:uncharacterized protein LOC132751782 [Ruditapes philippinarum]|uniref:uncharacterized protein LOC132751782 n=1 Tax=Ruditapes philippinarum TaxID=129788 RepID=UPI00295A7A65|nr:uncharacterized protein LOC132751782 [Ruditapes philippinarum]